MSSWFPWSEPKGKRTLDSEERKKAFKAVYADPYSPNSAEIHTPRGQADFIAYADAKKDPKSARYMREMERCSADNRASVGRLEDQKIAHRDFAYPASDRDQKYSGGSDDKGKGKGKGKESSDSRGGGGGIHDDRRASGQNARDYYSSRR